MLMPSVETLKNSTPSETRLVWFSDELFQHMSTNPDVSKIDVPYSEEFKKYRVISAVFDDKEDDESWEILYFVCEDKGEETVFVFAGIDEH